MTSLKPDFEEENEFAMEAHPILLWWAEAMTGLNRLPEYKRERLISRLTRDLYQTISTTSDTEISLPWPNQVPGFECPGRMESRCEDVRAVARMSPRMRTLQSLFEETPSLDQIKPIFQRTIEQQRTAGVPLQHIIHSLDQIHDEARRQMTHTLKHLHVGARDFKEIHALYQEQENWAQYVDRERQQLSAIMADRNRQGEKAERLGDITNAIDFYEPNVRDCFPGTHPYDRLRIIYTRHGCYADAIRVCRAYLSLPNREGRDKFRFQQQLDLLLEKQKNRGVGGK
jgi:hypothetical protein